MNFIENLRLALTSLRANKMRAFLTMLGIIIGISSVIGILTLGDSLTMFVTNDLEDAGANLIALSVQEKKEETVNIMGQMMFSASYSMDASAVPMTKDLLDFEKLDRLQSYFGERIRAVGVYQSGPNGQVKDGRKEANVFVYGVNEGFMYAQGVEVLNGRWINDGDIKGAKRVVCISENVVDKLFDGVASNATGKEIKLYTGGGVQSYGVVGVFKNKSQMANMMMSQSDMPTEFYIPISVIEQDYGYDASYSSAYVVGPTGGDVEKLTKDIDDYFKKEYRMNSKWMIQVSNFEQMLSTMTSMLSTVSLVISIIAGISLLVGGVGVMNIMLVSVTERTKEIGTRMAIGARGSYIRMQFITESVILCGIGGAIGVGLGQVLGFIGSALIGFPARASIPAIVGSVAFSMVIGIFFGFYPANKAAKLDPIEALRYE